MDCLPQQYTLPSQVKSHATVTFSHSSLIVVLNLELSIYVIATPYRYVVYSSVFCHHE